MLKLKHISVIPNSRIDLMFFFERETFGSHGLGIATYRIVDNFFVSIPHRLGYYINYAKDFPIKNLDKAFVDLAFKLYV